MTFMSISSPAGYGFDSQLFRPEEGRRSGSGGNECGTDGERAGNDESSSRHGHDDPGDNDCLRQHTERMGELLPDGPSNGDADWHTDDEADQGDRRRLPPHRIGDLSPYETQSLEEAGLSPTPGHAHHEDVHTMSTRPKIRGKFTASPKLTRLAGVTG